jgi:hypothetical protein
MHSASRFVTHADAIAYSQAITYTHTSTATIATSRAPVRSLDVREDRLRFLRCVAVQLRSKRLLLASATWSLEHAMVLQQEVCTSPEADASTDSVAHTGTAEIAMRR